ncbi:nascent polypeptide-associated complex subunit alpha, muscle-specific form-like [Homarus americanus]|uniref:nascent polypeptide-associated complex subunit alpha, muscle-specific form-like n=1 Tax=Homarus americanus TaxID=6706 RepID=UPI001C4929DF|nr:nascent polypeptide-associated complex subunit alpha, muscle-specific form-like [Homarus americanus]
MPPSGDGTPKGPCNISGILRCILWSDGTPGTLTGAAEPAVTYPGAAQPPGTIPQTVSGGVAHQEPSQGAATPPRRHPVVTVPPRAPRNISGILRCILRSDGSPGTLTGAAEPAGTYPGAAQPPATIPETVPGAVVHWKPSQVAAEPPGTIPETLPEMVAPQSTLPGASTPRETFPGTLLVPETFLEVPGGSMPLLCRDAPRVPPSGDGTPRGPCNISGILRCILKSDGTPGTLTGAAEPAGTYPGAAQPPRDHPTDRFRGAATPPRRHPVVTVPPRAPRNISGILRCILRSDGSPGTLTGAVEPVGTFPGAGQSPGTIPETVPGAVVHWKLSQVRWRPQGPSQGRWCT